MVFNSAQRQYNDDYINYRHHSLNELYNLQQVGNYWENRYLNNDIIDDDVSLATISPEMCDIASTLKFDHSDDLKYLHDNAWSSSESMMSYPLKHELEDVYRKENFFRSNYNLTNQEPMDDGCSHLQCPRGAVLLMPNGDVHMAAPGQVVSTIVPVSQPLDVISSCAERRWFSGISRTGYHGTSDMSPQSRKSLRSPEMKQQLSRSPNADGHLPSHPNDDVPASLWEETVIKVRNVHPTACLHELHVQRRDLFSKKPIFSTTKIPGRNRKKCSFTTVCNFTINKAKLRTWHMARTKSDAKVNAARNMLRKLNTIRNLTIVLDDEKTNTGAFASFEHPRCQLLYLHDTYPEMYPISPSFQASRCWALPPSHNKSRYINYTCHFQVGRDMLATVGAGNNKKQAIVKAARNMLQRIFPKLECGEDTKSGTEKAKKDRKKSPWKCHFCNIYMTGRKPFLSHLVGRHHIQRLSEMNLDAVEQNKILEAAAEMAYKKKQEENQSLEIDVNAVEQNKILQTAGKACKEKQDEKRSTTLKKRSRLQKQCETKERFCYNNKMNMSFQNSQDFEYICRNTSSSSEKSEFETSYSNSLSGDMKTLELFD